MRDPYTILGVAKTATENDIKQAFRKLAKQYHPDFHPNDLKAKEKFAEINQAYEILGDKDKRKRFDRGEIDAEGKPLYTGFDPRAGFSSGSDPFGGTNPFNGGNFNFRSLSSTASAGFDPSSFFKDIFGAGAQKSSFNHGKERQPLQLDLRTSLYVTLENMVSQEKLQVVFPNGKSLKVKIPTYVEDGQILRLKGQGLRHNFQVGDALIDVHIKKHALFRLEGRAIHVDAFVPLKEAILGGKISVPTLEGQISLTVPPWSSSDRILRLKEKGLFRKEGGREDLYVHVRIMLPNDKDPALEAFFQTK